MGQRDIRRLDEFRTGEGASRNGTPQEVRQPKGGDLSRSLNGCAASPPTQGASAPGPKRTGILHQHVSWRDGPPIMAGADL